MIFSGSLLNVIVQLILRGGCRTIRLARAFLSLLFSRILMIRLLLWNITSITFFFLLFLIFTLLLFLFLTGIDLVALLLINVFDRFSNFSLTLYPFTCTGFIFAHISSTLFLFGVNFRFWGLSFLLSTWSWTWDVFSLGFTSFWIFAFRCSL